MACLLQLQPHHMAYSFYSHFQIYAMWQTTDSSPEEIADDSSHLNNDLGFFGTHPCMIHLISLQHLRHGTQMMVQHLRRGTETTVLRNLELKQRVLLNWLLEVQTHFTMQCST